MVIVIFHLLLSGNFLAVLARVTKAKHCLEVGMFTGFGTLSMAENVPDDGTVTALELQQPAANYARENFDKSPHGKKITIKVGITLILNSFALKGITSDKKKLYFHAVGCDELFPKFNHFRHNR